MEVVTMAALVTLAILSTWYGFDRRTRRRALAARFDHTSRQLDELTVPLATVVDNLHRQIELVRGAYAEDELPRVLGTSTESLRAGNSLLVRRSDLAGEHHDPVRDKDLDGVSRSLHTWQDLEESVRKALPALRAEEERLTAAIARSVEIEHRLCEVTALTERLRSSIDTATARGFRTATAASLLESVPGRVDEIQQLVADRHVLAAQDPLDVLLSDLTTAIDDLGHLPHRKQRLTARLDDLARTLQELHELSGHAAAAHTELTANYAEVVARGLDQCRAAADEHARRAEDQLARAQESLNDGDLDRVERLAEAADASHDAAHAQLRHPMERLATVRELRRRLPERKARLYDHTVELEKRAEREAVTESFTAVAREIRTQLERIDLTSEQPDWLECERRIREIETLVNRTDAGVRHCLTAIGQLRGEARSLTRRLREERSARYEAEGSRRWWSEPAF